MRDCYRLCNDGQLQEALHFAMSQGQDVGRALEVFIRILRGCTQTKDLRLGRQVHHAMFNLISDAHDQHCLISDPYLSRLGCELIRMFASCGDLREAIHVFTNLPSKNAYSWTAIISVLTHHGFCQKALELYQEMQVSGTGITPHIAVAVIKACASIATLHQGQLIHSDVVKQELWSDIFVGSALVDMYCKCGTVEDAVCVFDSLPHKDVVMWSAMAAGYAQHGYGAEALQLYERMQEEGMEPNEVTFVSILKSCASMKTLDQGMLIHSEVIKRNIDANLIIGNVLVDMYSKCGSLEDAVKMFEALPTKDVISWNAIIAAFFQRQDFNKAMHFFNDMQREGIEPNKPTILCLLKTFSAAGDRDQVMLSANLGMKHWIYFEG